MINLLPPAYRKEIRAGFANGLLLRYTLLLAGALLFLIAAFGLTYLSLSQSISQAEETKTTNQQEAAGYSQTQAAASALRNDLSSAQSLFDSEVLLSKAIVRFSSLLPDGTAVDSLDINNDNFTESRTVSVQVKNRAAAESLSRNFEQSSYIASSTLKEVTTNGDSTSYPYTAILEFSFDRSIGQ